MQRANSFHYENKVLTVPIKSIFVVVSLIIYLSFLLAILILIKSTFYILVVSLTIFIMIDYKPASSAPRSEPCYGALRGGK